MYVIGYEPRSTTGLENGAPRLQPIGDAAECVDISPAIDFASQRLLRCDVVRRPARETARREIDVFAAAIGGHFHQPKVQHLHEIWILSVATHEYVLGLDVAVDQTMLVRFGQ